jgi:putative transposase
VHLVIRAHNRAHLFREEAVKELLYKLLLKHKADCEVQVYHYVFMDNHIHLVLYAAKTELLSDFMRQVFGKLARFVNKLSGRSGRVFGDRARTPAIQDRRYMFSVMRYIDANPVRAGMVRKAHHHRWSSFRHYAFGEENALVDDAPDYLGLSRVAAIRRRMYQEMSLSVPGRGKRDLPEYSVWFFIGDRDWVAMMMARRGLRHRKKPPG